MSQLRDIPSLRYASSLAINSWQAQRQIDLRICTIYRVFKAFLFRIRSWCAQVTGLIFHNSDLSFNSNSPFFDFPIASPKLLGRSRFRLWHEPGRMAGGHYY